MKKKVYIFWTGGLDSTYRVFELSQKDDVDVQPCYIVDNSRPSTQMELSAISKLTQLIKDGPNYKENLQELMVVNENDLDTPKEYIDAQKRLFWTYKYYVGDQYIYMAAFCRKYGVKVEMSLENADRSKARNCIVSEINLADAGDEYCFGSLKNGNEDAQVIFGNILLPKTVWGMSKLDEANVIKEQLPELLDYIHFCHNSVNGVPCGCCPPCKDYAAEGLQFIINDRIKKYQHSNIISNNCFGGFLYKKIGINYQNPFIFTSITINDFEYLVNNYKNIDFNNIVYREHMQTYWQWPVSSIFIDGKIFLYYTHWASNEKAKDITRKEYVQNVRVNIKEGPGMGLLLTDLYKKRVQDMKEAPQFIYMQRYDSDDRIKRLIDNTKGSEYKKVYIVNNKGFVTLSDSNMMIIHKEVVGVQASVDKLWKSICEFFNVKCIVQ